MTVKKIIQRFLIRFPRLYHGLLRLKRNPNWEKMNFLVLVEKGNEVLDIGANRGHYSLLFSQIVQEQGNVHSFEPIPGTFSMLKSRIEEEGCFSNVRLNPFGLADIPQTMTIYLPDGDDGQASLRQHDAGSWTKQNIKCYEAPFSTIDLYTQENVLKKIDFIKIDVEGGELLVLRGGIETLKRYQPVIHWESFRPWAKNFHYEPGEIIDLLRSFGYRYFYDEERHLLESPVEFVNQSEKPENIIGSTRILFS